MRRSLSSLRSKLYAHSTTSIERSKDYVWDGLENQALNRSEEYISNYRPSAYHIGSQKTRPIRSNMDTSHDIVATNYKAHNMINHKKVDLEREDGKLSEYEPICIAGGNSTDRTSLLQSEHTVS